ncbi:hypothetical protein [Hymenobacter sp. YC55]|uniref:hypothetical protein n=1 Tax=Hymenobacter sp. YC55 TaxID=3034019 RepID=UPI0023F6579B|nr:hypothetical protein [Hymenobacter sp. YC55]MDF7810746.1 hypothetical protein [Hymenobacter sp. YC55]
MISPSLTFEDQATACLKAAELHRATLLKFARGISGGDDEAGRELFQEAVLRAHETIQAHGFYGEGYQFYIWRVIKNLRQEQKQAAKRLKPLRASEMELEEEHVIDYDSRAHLADQINYELSERCTPADVALFQLHVNGQSYRDIEQLTGKNYRTVGHKIRQIKTMLQGLFTASYEGLQ